ncbi:flavoprotein [Streptomyces sp. DSM 44917]|uniref:Flavoprotein n=1 Tax=Streptomyces boetiae TaxID=3075541 RepID=A0ABU2L9X0_9ACTN|nr:flavoprotein [Streptomyces sp. DSM 44917]MDT0308374.1 flavoprotein [Streptomyces sp. DSM 44917]
MTSSRVLYLVACAAPPSQEVHTGIATAQAAGWDVCLVLTPSAARWLENDLPRLAEITGHPVRSAYKRPGEPDVLPAPDAILVAPATSNTINKWAQGISDTLALGLITEAIGLGVPLVALPYLNQAQAAHPAFARSVATLRASGVAVLLGEGGFVPHPARKGTLETFSWDAGVAALATVTP